MVNEISSVRVSDTTRFSFLVSDTPYGRVSVYVTKDAIVSESPQGSHLVTWAEVDNLKEMAQRDAWTGEIPDDVGRRWSDPLDTSVQ